VLDLLSKIEFNMAIICVDRGSEVIKSADNSSLNQKVYELVAQIDKEVDELSFSPNNIINHIGANESQANNKGQDKEFQIVGDANGVNNDFEDKSSEESG